MPLYFLFVPFNVLLMLFVVTIIHLISSLQKLSQVNEKEKTNMGDTSV